MGIEPTTLCLEGRCSTTELHPLTQHYSGGGLSPEAPRCEPLAGRFYAGGSYGGQASR